MTFFSSNTFCPVSYKKVDEHVARFNAAISVLLIITFLITQNVLPLILLAIDFLLRASGQEKMSVVAFTSSNIVRYFKVNGNSINAGPKLFAARIGFTLSLVAAVLWLFEWKAASLLLVSLLGLFSFLEAAAGICVACIIYPYVYRLMYR
jgi:hypothetical protein